MIDIFKAFNSKLNILSDLPLLAMRLILAYGFWGPGMMKWKDINAIGAWFESMGYPMPMLNAYAAATTEVAGAVLLIFGFATRIISIPLMIVMLVAIFTVHGANGFEAANNGFEIPLYYLIMLFTLLIYGGGKISIDGILKKIIK
ncbi:MAG: DoxX family protein [Bacteroidetes bacterium CG2_30_33_31]|nr:MAG: DoxX family protein [Bacteroidetes bacterium CG2_30_33_31]